jgi:ABC-type transport system substrate-binding protein
MEETTMATRTLVAGLLAALLTTVGAAAQTLVVAALKTPGGFDGDALKPATQNVVTQVYEGLTIYTRSVGADGVGKLDFAKPAPHLAEKWTVTPDGLTYVITLRRGVRSPFGNELTADDVVWSWEKSFAQKRTGLFIANVTGVTKVEKLDRYEVKFSLKAPSEIFLHAITNYVPSIYDSTEVKKHVSADDPYALKWIDQNTAGFGAYHLESVRQGEQAVFVANPHYFGGAPHYKRVVYREIPSAGSRFQLLQTGQVQWIEELTHKQITELQKDRRVKVVGVQGTAMASVRMNPRFKPFDDLRVRRAVALATDYDAINTAVFEGLGSRPKGIVPPIIPGALDTIALVQPDIARAKALLAEAGHPDGVEMTLEYSGIEWWEEGIAIQLQRAVAPAGIRLQLKRITDADMRARTAINRRDLPMFTFKDFPFVLDPIYKMFNDAHRQGAANRNDYTNPEFDRLLDQGAVEIDPAKRLAMAARAQQLHAEDSTWIYIAYPGHFEAMAPCIRGYTWYPDYHERWRELVCQ